VTAAGKRAQVSLTARGSREGKRPSPSGNGKAQACLGYGEKARSCVVFERAWWGWYMMNFAEEPCGAMMSLIAAKKQGSDMTAAAASHNSSSRVEALPTSTIPANMAKHK
jgi:hypothetical protein